MSRNEFLERVRTAAAAGRAYRVHVDAIPEGTGYIGAGDDPVARFAAEVRAVGGQAHVAADTRDARAIVGRLLDELSTKSVLCWEHESLRRLELDGLFASKGITALSQCTLAALDPSEARRRALSADVGITGVTWAVAETGSVAVASGPGTERIVSLVPPVYITLVERERIVPDLFDLFVKFDTVSGQRLPSNLALITGPSKTGDIELKLTTGVHGPGVWHVVVF